MAKFATNRSARSAEITIPVVNPLRQPDALTAKGGEGWTRSAKTDLYLLGASNFVSEQTFHEDAAKRDERFVSLIAEVAASDPDWLVKFATHLRGTLNMRSASIVVAATYAALGKKGDRLPNVRQIVSAALQRPDEPGEFLAYWFANHGRSLPAAVKRGLADAVQRLYTQNAALRYDGKGNEWRLGDVIDLVHPKPVSEEQAELFKYLLDKRHNRDAPRVGENLTRINARLTLETAPEETRRALLGSPLFKAGAGSWEWQSGWLPGGMDTEAWEAAIDSGMGLMALIRNLRNFDQAGISAQARKRIISYISDPEKVRASRAFPLRFLAAYYNAGDEWKSALARGLEASTQLIPRLPGRTAVLVDVSGSMFSFGFSQRSTTEPVDQAALFGVALARRAEESFLYSFSNGLNFLPDSWRKGSVFAGVELVKNSPSGGTALLQSLSDVWTHHAGQLDRIVVLTDEQGDSRWSDGRFARQAVDAIRVPIHTINLVGYRVGSTDEQRSDRFYYSGLTDAMFSLIPIFEAAGQGDVDPIEYAERLFNG